MSKLFGYLMNLCESQVNPSAINSSSCSLLLEPQVYPLEDKTQTDREKERT